MRIARSHFIDPAANTPFGVVAIAISMFVFAYSLHYGKAAILVFYALWLPLLALSPQLLLGSWTRVLSLLVLPGACVLSPLWSDAPQVTLRGAIQYASTVVCGLIAARVIAQQT